MSQAAVARWVLSLATAMAWGAGMAQAQPVPAPAPPAGGFEIIELPPLAPPATEAGPRPGEEATTARARGLESWNFSAHATADFGNPNESSLLNPGNAALRLRDSGSYLEVRASASDRLDAIKDLRWLIKTFAASSDDSPTAPATRARFDEVFVDWRRDRWFASIGKRRVNWGHASAFNPVNVVAPPRDPLEPAFQTEGRRLAWVSYSGPGTVDLLLTRNEACGPTQWGLRWDGSAGTKSGALYFFDGRKGNDGSDFGRMLGASFSMDVVPGLTFYGEAARFSVNDRRYYGDAGEPVQKASGFQQAVLGSQLDLGGRSRANVEIFRNGRGYSRDERSNYFDALRAPLGRGVRATDFEVLAMNRLYGLLSFRKEVREQYAGTATLLAAADGSFSARAEIAYTVSDYYEVKGVYVRSGGGRGTEFGNSLYRDLFQLQLSASF